MVNKTGTMPGLFTVAAALAPAAASAEPPPGWQVEWAEGVCSVIRPSPGEPALKLQITPGNGRASLSITGSGVGRVTGRQLKRMELWLDPGGAFPAEPIYLSSAYPEGPFLSFGSEEPSMLDRLAQARSISVRVGARTLFDFSLPAAAQAVAALRACEHAGLVHHGIDPDAWRALRSVPRLTIPLLKLVRYQDYPKEAVAAGASGTVLVRVSVDAAGKPSKCDWIARSGSEPLDRVTCKILMERARFHPAIDASGKPAPSYFVTKMSWRTG
jgi:TonB family protein